MSQKIESITPTSDKSESEKNVGPVGEEKHNGVNDASSVTSTEFNYEGVREVLDTLGTILKEDFRKNEATAEGAESTGAKQSNTSESNTV